MRVLILVAVFASIVHVAYSLCGACTVGGTACVETDAYQFCEDGLPQGQIIQCLPGYICSTLSARCVPRNVTNMADCLDCGVCNSQGVFACTGHNTFKLCYGSTRLADNEYTCPNNLVCDYMSQTICIDPTETGTGYTCPASVTTTTTTSTTTEPSTTTINPEVSPNQFCRSQNKTARYDIPSDNSCSKYINCYQSNNVWYGNIFVCPKYTYFNSTTQMCGRAIPSRCLPEQVCD